MSDEKMEAAIATLTRVWKECGRKGRPKVVDIIRGLESVAPQRILIVFWHGIGDLLMFYPLYDQLKKTFPQHKFDLGLLPGVDHGAIIPEGKEIPEKDFLKDHDFAFVLSFHMVEGSNHMTKAEFCIQQELGDMGAFDLVLPKLAKQPNRLVGVHFQGTCLPGSTNPDEAVAKRIWDDLIEWGYVPIDLHFEHVFHNPVNKPFLWAERGCRGLKPSLGTLLMLIQRCHAVVAVASGPFVLSMCNNPERTIYLQKNHKIDCYVKGFKNVVDLAKYDRGVLLSMLNNINEKG